LFWQKKVWMVVEGLFVVFGEFLRGVLGLMGVERGILLVSLW
jgi:hypothetical protein